MPYRKPNPYGQRQPPVGCVLDRGDPINARVLALWLMNEGGGVNLFDMVANITAPFTGTPSWRLGKFGKAVSFGNNNYCDLGAKGASLLDLTTPFSVSVWVYRTATLTNLGAVIVSSKQAGFNGGWLLLGMNTNKIRFYIDTTGGGAFGIAETNAALPINEWHHICGTWDGATVRIYQDGILQTTTAAAASIVYGTKALNPMIGNYASLYWLGALDNIRFIGRALLGGEVMRLLSEPFAGIYAPSRRIISATGVAATGAGPLVYGGQIIHGPLIRGGRVAARKI